MHDVEPPNIGLDALLRARFHGAVNIRGIRYQLLYSVLLTLRLYEPIRALTSVRFEGIEDVDLMGLKAGDEYVQVKTAVAPWHWAQLKGPVKGFIEVLRADLGSRFALALDFEPREDIAKLARLASLPITQQSAVRKKFRRLCRDVGVSDAQADSLVDRLSISSLSEGELLQSLRRSLAEVWSLGSEAVDVYLDALVARTLGWAKDRATVSRVDLDRVRAEVGEALAREFQFQAFGSGLVDRLSWAPDVHADDFFEGKSTRPGHVAAGLDVPRPVWMDRIDAAVNAAGICVVRSSSGQGKSVLAYRYAFERWPHKDTFALRAAHTPEQVEAVRNHLEFRARVGLPTYLLVDDAGNRTQLWPDLARACAASGIPVLVAVRNEDWYRFARRNAVSFEVVEPNLDLEEARQLFVAFRSAGRLHTSVDSAEWAYERIGEPHLLIEYVYLLTHGRMLAERLRDQLNQFERLTEDPAKTELVRRVALADTLGAPVRVEQLLRDLRLSSDPQSLLRSLLGEYVELKEGALHGLHWVRSEHLAEILHEGYPNSSDTAVSVLPAVPIEYLVPFVANALIRPGLDGEAFMRGLAARARREDVAFLLACLEGAFEAGEQRYLEANRSLFDEAYAKVGSGGAFLLSSALLPVVKTDALASLAQMPGPNFGGFHELAQLVNRAVVVPRGLDLCRDLLTGVTASIRPDDLLEDLGRLGRLLDWCSLTGVALPAWAATKNEVLGSVPAPALPLKDLCALAQGIYRYDERAYRAWFVERRDDVLGYLKLHTDTLALDVTDDAVSIQFIADASGQESANSQVVSRLTYLRSALPFCDRYQGQGAWILPLGLKPSHDETYKNISKEHLPLPSDVDKNAVWSQAVAAAYLPDSYYRYQQAWHGIRLDALQLVEALARGLPRLLVEQPFDFYGAFERGELLRRLATRLNKTADPPAQTPEHVKTMLRESPRNWVGAFQNFFSQVISYVQDRSDEQAGRLTIYNFREASSLLSAMHESFSRLWEFAPDYFDGRAVAARERTAYPYLGELLEIWIEDPPRVRYRDIKEYAQQRRRRNRDKRLGRLRQAATALRHLGVGVTMPSDFHFSHPFHHVALAFAVDNPCHPENELQQVVEALVPTRDAADFFWLVPTYDRARLMPGGYSLNALQLGNLDRGETINWEALVPRDVPDDVSALLPDLPYLPLQSLEIRSAVWGVLLALGMVIDQRAAVAPLRSASGPYADELQRRHEEKLADITTTLVAAAQAAHDQLQRGLGHLDSRAEYRLVAEFLGGFGQNVGERPCDEGQEPESGALEAVVQALESLACGGTREPSVQDA